MAHCIFMDNKAIPLIPRAIKYDTVVTQSSSNHDDIATEVYKLNLLSA